MSHARASSPSPTRAPKRQKLNGHSDADPSAEAAFVPGLFSPDSIAGLARAYDASEPYKHAVLDALFDDALLRRVKDEIVRELRFAEKETDIYKVHQTGDLASLSYLPPAQRALFPALLTLRNALYSPAFRSFLRAVTGCGPLSGTKADMSINSYRKGCHLLNHDDVIGSRRVSYILYMPLSGRDDPGWKDEFGGALELYPVRSGKEGEMPEPAEAPTKRIPPAWNQFVFFEVQPGQSFHSVEEVVVGTDEDGRQRLSISGWFHKAQKGEPGYGDPSSDRTERLQSSLEQLTSSPSIPLTPYPSPLPPFLPTPTLSESHLSFLSDYLNPLYLQPRALLVLSRQFALDSHLRLGDFLCAPLAEKLEGALREQDAKDGLGPGRKRRIPLHNAGVDGGQFEVRGPPHKARYCVLSPSSPSPSDPTSLSPFAPTHTAPSLLHTLQSTLFPSPAFRALLGALTSLVPLSHSVTARRFRPGLDYTLAQSEEDDARLDVVLGLTPTAECEGKGKGRLKETELGWETMEWGGWDCYMPPHEGDEDPAVYRSRNGKRPEREERPEIMNGRAHENGNGNGVYATVENAPSAGRTVPQDRYVPPLSDDDDEERFLLPPGFDTPETEDHSGPPAAKADRSPKWDDAGGENALVPPASDHEDDSVASDLSDFSDPGSDEEGGADLTQPALFNALLIVLRDPQLMRFVKYVSAAATGSRWDVCGEWEVGQVEEEEEGERDRDD